MAESPARRTEDLPPEYPQFLAEVKAQIAVARTRATLAVNSELIGLYWEIGHEILEREQREGWGAKVINRLAADLRREFPDMTGLSLRNLRYMRAFAGAWPSESPSSIVQRPVAQLPWGHNVSLLDKLDDSGERLWYASEALESGWSRKVLEAQIATDLRGRQGSALTSFGHALPEPDSELVRDAIKDPYNFEFLSLSKEAKERDLELALLNDVQPSAEKSMWSTPAHIGTDNDWISRMVCGSRKKRITLLMTIVVWLTLRPCGSAVELVVPPLACRPSMTTAIAIAKTTSVHMQKLLRSWTNGLGGTSVEGIATSQAASYHS